MEFLDLSYHIQNIDKQQYKKDIQNTKDVNINNIILKPNRDININNNKDRKVNDKQ